MRILFVNAYFMPETTALSHLEKDLIEGLVAAGHEIQVICPTPTRGVSKQVHKQYRSVKTEILYGGSVRVRRFWAPREGKNPLVRALRYFWCNLREFQIGKKQKNIHGVFAISTPPTQGLLAGKLSRKLKCPFIYSLQDIFPDSLVTTGLAKKDSLIWKIGSWIEGKTYGYAHRIVVISESCKKNLLDKGVAEEKLALISNWVDTDAVSPVRREDNKLISEFDIDPKRFLVVYAGNFGMAQGAGIVLEAAQMLRSDPQIQFVIFGGGAEFDAAVKYVESNHVTNVKIHGLLPQERVSEVYSLGDVALITCKPGVGGSGMPSKTWSIMACNTPVIASFDTEGDMADVLAQSHGGVCVEPGSAEALAGAILQAKAAAGGLSGGRAYVLEHAAKTVCVGRYIDIITSGDHKER